MAGLQHPPKAVPEIGIQFAATIESLHATILGDEGS